MKEERERRGDIDEREQEKDRQTDGGGGERETLEESWGQRNSMMYMNNDRKFRIKGSHIIM